GTSSPSTCRASSARPSCSRRPDRGRPRSIAPARLLDLGRVVAQERQALGHPRRPELEVVLAGAEEELVIDLRRGQRLVDVLDVVLQREVVLGAAVEVQRDLAGAELLREL